jgi:hypothetical protein
VPRGMRTMTIRYVQPSLHKTTVSDPCYRTNGWL